MLANPLSISQRLLLAAPSIWQLVLTSAVVMGTGLSRSLLLCLVRWGMDPVWWGAGWSVGEYVPFSSWGVEEFCSGAEVYNGFESLAGVPLCSDAFLPLEWHLGGCCRLPALHQSFATFPSNPLLWPEITSGTKWHTQPWYRGTMIICALHYTKVTFPWSKLFSLYHWSS